MKDSNCGQKNSKKKLYSYHTFLFPFRWDCCNKKNSRSIYDTAYQDRFNIEKFSSALTCQNGWEYAGFEINNNKDFNEYVYFYDYVRDAIYNREKKISQNHTTYYFKYEHRKGDYYNIYIKEKKEPYQLKVDEISIKTYDTGVAILRPVRAKN